MTKNNTRIHAAVKATKEVLGSYWDKTVEQRLGFGGSCYPDYSKEELEKAILNADWEEAPHPAVMSGCTAFKATVPGGIFGLYKIEDLPEGTELEARDPKGTGYISFAIDNWRMLMGNRVDETWLILGPEQGREVVYTFHPGEPVQPSSLSVDDLDELREGAREEFQRDGWLLVSREEALEHGFAYCKLIFS